MRSPATVALVQTPPLPPEMIAAADTLCNQSHDLLMHACALSGEMRRPGPLERHQLAMTMLADEARAAADLAVRLGETLARHLARAAS